MDCSHLPSYRHLPVRGCSLPRHFRKHLVLASASADATRRFAASGSNAGILQARSTVLGDGIFLCEMKHDVPSWDANRWRNTSVWQQSHPNGDASTPPSHAQKLSPQTVSPQLSAPIHVKAVSRSAEVDRQYQGHHDYYTGRECKPSPVVTASPKFANAYNVETSGCNRNEENQNDQSLSQHLHRSGRPSTRETSSWQGLRHDDRGISGDAPLTLQIPREARGMCEFSAALATLVPCL